MGSISNRKLVSIATGDGVLPQNWLGLTAQPLYSSAVDKLRDIETRVCDAQRAGLQSEADRLQADRVEAETQLIRITERLHRELEELLEPTLKAFVRSTLNAIGILVRWQSVLSSSRSAVQSTGFSPSAVPYRVTVDAMLNCSLNPALVLLIGQAQADGVITSAEALALLSGKQLDAALPH